MIYSIITYQNRNSHFLKIIGIFFGFLSVFIGTGAADAQTTLQRMVVSEMESNVPGVTLDYPGQAIVVIESTMGTLRFGSNMDGIVAQSRPSPGEYVLFVEPQNQILTIDAPGFIQQRYPLRGLNARQVVNLRVEPEQQTSELISVIFNVEPVDAALFVDGERTPANETVQLPPGQVNVRIEREGYRTVMDRPEITERNIQFNYLLSRVEQELVRIRTRPAQAEVFVNNVREGHTDADGILDMFRFPGEYPLRIALDGYETVDTVIGVVEEADNEFSFTLLRNTGTLRLSLNPADATVMINRQRQELRGGMVELAPGMHSLEVSRANHDTYTETIRIERGQTLSRTIRLEPHTGTLQLAVSPSRASVRLVDEQGTEVRRWTGSQRAADINAGNYRVEASLQGYDTRTEQVQISRNETTTIRIELSQTQERVAPQARVTGFECGDPVTFTYAGERVTYGTVRSARNRCWLDRNLGASRAATSSTDSQAYGDLYQWGRAADGHQRRNSPTTTTLSSSDQPGHGSFILSNSGANWDWRSPQNNNLWQGVNGINNPCPDGYRLPTEAEWNAERQSWSSNNSAGYYWSGTVDGTYSRFLDFSSSSARMGSYSRADGFSVRCLKN